MLSWVWVRQCLRNCPKPTIFEYCRDYVKSSCSKCNIAFLAYRDRNNLGLDDSDPSQGEIDGMSSFLNDTMIMNTTSTPLTMPQKKQSTGDGGGSDGVETPEFRALQRRLESTLRTKRNLTIALVISLLILVVFLIMLFAK